MDGFPSKWRDFLQNTRRDFLQNERVSPTRMEWFPPEWDGFPSPEWTDFLQNGRVSPARESNLTLFCTGLIYLCVFMSLFMRVATVGWYKYMMGVIHRIPLKKLNIKTNCTFYCFVRCVELPSSVLFFSFTFRHLLLFVDKFGAVSCDDAHKSAHRWCTAAAAAKRGRERERAEREREEGTSYIRKKYVKL